MFRMSEIIKYSEEVTKETEDQNLDSTFRTCVSKFIIFDVIRLRTMKLQLYVQKMFNKHHLIDKNNQIDKEVVRKYLKKRHEDKSYAEIIHNITEYCFDFIDQNVAEIQKVSGIDIKKCNHSVAAFFVCHNMMLERVRM
jgi:hypothetical protein